MLNNKNNIFVKTMIFVVLAIILTVGVTYAYFRANITGVESVSTISVGGATLAIKYEGSNLITAENVIPGWSAKKYFNVDVTNTSGRDISYDIKLVVENNNFDTEDTINSWLEFSLYECNSAEDKVCDIYLSDDRIYTQSGDQDVYRATTNVSERTYYALEMVFPNLNEEQSQTGTDGDPLTFSGYITLTSANEIYKRSFADDSWDTIVDTIISGNYGAYQVGDEKEVEIDMNDDGIAESYTVRIANNSNYDSTLVSHTACGFVIEFVDIVEQSQMNSSLTNDSGWGSTAVRTYLNEDFKAKLPIDLQDAIVNTTVVTGSVLDGTRYFSSFDDIYLLSAKEVWGNCTESNCYDTVTNYTRQLDYYANKGVTKDNNYSESIKKYNGTATNWWLRTYNSSNNTDFLSVGTNGEWGSNNANMSYGLAPAFRIGAGNPPSPM